jgi:hypothetical protein
MPLMQLTEPIAAPAVPSTAKTETGVTEPATAEVPAIALAYALLAVGAVGGILLWKWRDPATFVAGAGISVFAPLYILAQGIERFIEPFSSQLSPKAPGTANETKAKAQQDVSTAIKNGNADEAAKNQLLVDRIRRNTGVIAWGLASFLGMLLCGLFGLLMLRLVGFRGVPAEADIVISGLAVGSGTKPLHDLISNMQRSKDQKEDPPQRTGA